MPSDKESTHRRLATPTPGTSASRREETDRRSRSRSRRDVQSRSSHGERDRGRSHSYRDREKELKLQQERVRRLEIELDRERSMRQSRQRSRRTSPRQSRQRSRNSVRPRARVSDSPRDTSARRSSYRHDDNIPRREPYSLGRSRSRSRKDTRHDTRATPPQRARTPSFTAGDVADIINSLRQSKPQSSPAHSAVLNTNQTNTKNILPDFDPSSKNQRVDVWLKKVNESAAVYGWDERTTVYFAMQKLQGLAKVWYEGLNSILFSWAEWQTKLINAFPCEQNYGQALEDMLKRKSRYNEPVELYYYEKLALVNRCDIDGKRAVDCIIHGLSDKTIKTGALALRCTNPEQLLQFLMSNKETHSFMDRNMGQRNKINENQSNNSNSRPPLNKTEKSQFTSSCFNCKERGHPFFKKGHNYTKKQR
ncbi:uncharacterized protein LOC126379085 [Pectinophora gossypiella]|uniref:uncharacterized protein LOC126379085 n=1 Tax=Pectinophora gossypiella TaxID=13191 RepID=UPI00214F09F2|nr:uncharacterized protein LOC126379085 [Pectinophora gossypiella]